MAAVTVPGGGAEEDSDEAGAACPFGNAEVVGVKGDEMNSMQVT